LLAAVLASGCGEEDEESEPAGDEVTEQVAFGDSGLEFPGFEDGREAGADVPAPDFEPAEGVTEMAGDGAAGETLDQLGGELPEDAVETAVIPPDCGDGQCRAEDGESCLNCPDDCGWCTACGNGLCELGEPPENAQTCPLDCGYCGDGVCSMSELSPVFYCYWDCLAQCGDGLCQAGEDEPGDALAYWLMDCSPCGDGYCGLNEVLDPAYQACRAEDCEPDCGDGACTMGEGPESCPIDCGLCGDGICGKVGEATEPCPPDCVKPCGDGVCGGDETAQTCPVDCGSCGDGVCAIKEMQLATCPGDCPPECGDEACDAKESVQSCPGDCGCKPLCEPAWECGEDAAGCGQPCGQCPAGTVCLDRTCCVPDCTGKACGDDGCGGSCGQCQAAQVCGEDGLCHPADCLPACPQGACGADGCGGQCPPCEDGLECTQDDCVAGQCEHVVFPLYCLIGGNCQPSGAANSSNPCEECRPMASQQAWSEAAPGTACGAGGVCVGPACCPKAANCAGLECGADGCGDVCGTCQDGFVCSGGLCGQVECDPNCAGKQCGDNGCGGTCGSCDDGLFCTLDVCLLDACQQVVLPFFCVVDIGDAPQCVASGQDNPVDICLKCRPLVSPKGWSAGNDGSACGIGMVCWQGACCDKAMACAGKACGDDGCGGVCGQCKSGETCVAGLCDDGSCKPQCAGKQCGDDGCGGSCGNCPDDGNPCTSEDCNPAGACISVNLDVACDDGNPCTLSDFCVAGVCAGTPAAEVCNGLDDNCDGETDEGFTDTDMDGLADCMDTDDDGDSVQDAVDNCPLNSNPGQQDLDSDTQGDACDLDDDNDGSPDAGDCAPTDPKVHPAATEKCNGKDDDCDMVADGEGAQGCMTFYLDLDSDGFGTAPAKCYCGPTGMYKTTVVGDCNDANPAVNPAASEVCNGKDDNCDGKSDNENAMGCTAFYMDADGDGWGTGASKCLCSAGGGYTASQKGDCDDTKLNVHPGAAELCNGIDDNCDSQTDEVC
jgi:hypothetical protein